jgi:hypothetical protein
MTSECCQSLAILICVGEFMRQRVLYRAQTELKCKKGFRENIYNQHFIIYGQLVHSPF